MTALLLLALACASISLTITRTPLFGSARGWARERSVWLGKLVTCPYCTSHWVAFVLVLATTPVPHGVAESAERIVFLFAVVTLAAPMQWAIFAAISNIPSHD